MLRNRALDDHNPCLPCPTCNHPPSLIPAGSDAEYLDLLFVEIVHDPDEPLVAVDGGFDGALALTLGVAEQDPRRRSKKFLVLMAGNDSEGASPVDPADDSLARLDGVFENSIFGFVPADQDLGPGPDPEVPPQLEEAEVAQIQLVGVAENVPDLGDEGELGQKASAGRAGVVFHIQLRCQLHLRLARASLLCQQLSAIDPPLQLRDGGFEVLGGKGAQQEPLQAALPLDDAQGVASLAHGALPQHFAGDDEVGAA